VRLKQVEQGLALLEVEDTGVGFNVGAVDAFYDQRGSLGMVNMRERAELLNGLFRIDSAEGQGARIRVLIPLSDEATDRLRNGQWPY
jgi:signal transduction histidine kinase